jgi:hypothetical protein
LTGRAGALDSLTKERDTVFEEQKVQEQIMQVLTNLLLELDQKNGTNGNHRQLAKQYNAYGIYLSIATGTE